ncbi:hypothetical protein QH639_22090 [Lysinibacillus sp. 1 U-2021]|uniref:hypothetical protein n=1 Tax=Lysinibacillus sp. 1 U-2021 TaxID=3039426 RepID=UPI00247FD419|nr:hypothetical protein [Lysinibacillus sp. 1 U-2021]WGT38471.1 hypothetical protein QH639_22090 [Lysinibacillus sp. 1 U-2021]
MRNKRINLVIIAIVLVLCITGILFYSEYGTKNFGNELITNPDKFEKVVDSISVWEMKGGVDNKNIFIVNKDDELYNEVRSILNNWEAKRTLFKNMDVSDSYYKIVFTNKDDITNPINILISEDGMVNINAREYELVKGDLDELLNIAN